MVAVVRVVWRLDAEPLAHLGQRQRGQGEVVDEREVGPASASPGQLGGQQLRRLVAVQGLGLGLEGAGRAEPGLVGDQRGQQRPGVDVVVVHPHLEGAQGHLALGGGRDPGDDVGHVMGDEEVVELRRCGTGQAEPAALVEGEEGRAEAVGGQVGEALEPADELGLGRRRGGTEGRLDAPGEEVGDEAVVVGGGPFGAVLDEGAEQRSVRPHGPHGHGVALDELDLLQRLRMTARLEGDVDLMEPPPARR